MSHNDEETVNLASATIIFSSCALLFGLKRKGEILCRFKATCSLVNTGLTPLVFVHCPSVRSDGVSHSTIAPELNLSTPGTVQF